MQKYRNLENGFDEFMKEFQNTSAESVINELEELGVTFVHADGAKFNHEEASDMKLQAKN